MKNQLLDLQKKALTDIRSTASSDTLYELEVRYLGRKGSLTTILKGIKDLSVADKKTIGKLGNEIKNTLQQAFHEREKKITDKKLAALGGDFFDTSLPGVSQDSGRMHPISAMVQDVEDVFTAMGFDVAEAQQVEDDYHCFTALNIPEDHPARDMQDTLWIADIPRLLRTHTSSVQIRYMESHKPPIRIICPGAVYRKDDIDATHSPHFHQFEGLMVDEKTNLSHLKGVLTASLRALIHPDLELRFRSSYFPFVEPGLEVDVTCVMCEGKGCSVCKRSGWIELLGCGMVHPNVLKAVGIDSEKYQGFAFGTGIERITMIKHRINDIRLFFENDPRFLEQF
jgi:phenylalanyl-tRNA synthetase alpha chain